MVASHAYDMYRKTSVYDGMDPKTLILMLYEEALKRLHMAREGVVDNDPKKRGENLGRVIAIVTELNACLDERIKSEEIEFLRGLYNAILTELPRVNITNDVKPLDLSYRYIERLKEIWETNVMGRMSGAATEPAVSSGVPAKPSISVQEA